MKKLAITTALLLGTVACTVKVPTTPPENCGQQICAGAWAQCEGKQPVIILDVASKNQSKTPIKYTYKLFDSNGQLVEKGPGSKDLVKNIIISQKIPFSGKSTKVHALSGPDDIVIPDAVSVTC